MAEKHMGDVVSSVLLCQASKLCVGHGVSSFSLGRVSYFLHNVKMNFKKIRNFISKIIVKLHINSLDWPASIIYFCVWQLVKNYMIYTCSDMLIHYKSNGMNAHFRNCSLFESIS